MTNAQEIIEIMHQIPTGSVKVSDDELIDCTLIAMDVSLKMNGSMTTVHTSESSKYLGLLDSCTAGVLAQLNQNCSVILKAFLLTQKGKDLARKSADTRFRQIYILVYGDHPQGDKVGDILLEKNVFLQHPKWQDQQVTYYNPQYLYTPGKEIEIPERDESRKFLISNQSNQTPNDQIAAIFDSAQGPLEYSEVRMSDRLTVILKRYV